MSVVVVKTGGVVYGEGAMHKASGYGDTENVLGLLRYLGDRCTFVGQYYGELPCPAVKIDLTGVNEWDGEAQAACVPDIGPVDYVIDFVGGAYTRSWIDNPDFTTVQASASRYIGPQLKLMHDSGAKRICIVCDPRNYPKNYEMCDMWPECIPWSILSQENRSWDFKMWGTKIHGEAVYAACENWFSYGQHIDVSRCLATNKNGYLSVSHSHFDSKSTPKRIRDMKRCHWDYIRSIWPPGLRLCGRGWPEGWGDFSLKGPAVWEELGKTWGGPILPTSEGWSTSKLRKYLRAGAIPWLYDHSSIRYDAHYRVCGPDSTMRFLNEVGDVLIEDLIEAEERTRPNFETLERCLSGEKVGGYDIQ